LERARIRFAATASYIKPEARAEAVELWKRDTDGGEDVLFLTGTPSSLGTGSDLPRGSFVLLIDPCWLRTDELQIYARVNRMSSPAETYSWRIIYPENDLQKSILQRQKLRGEVADAAFRQPDEGERGDDDDSSAHEA